MGGTGKTPTTLLISHYLQEKGLRVAIILRGYKRKSKGYYLVSDGNKVLTTIGQSGDEAIMLAELSPNSIIIVDEDRVHGAQEAVKLGAQVILLDDGYQHVRLQRDLNIVLIDAEKHIPPVIPFGRAREDSGATRDADLLLLTNVNANNGKKQLVFTNHQGEELPIAYARTRVTSLLSIATGENLNAESFRGKKVLAVSSIAHPERFYNTVNSLGTQVIAYSLGDHAEYSEAVIIKILNKAKSERCEAIVTTSKDIVKAREYYEEAATPVYVLLYELELIHNKEVFYKLIDNAIHANETARV